MKRLSWKYVAGLIDGEGCLDFMVMKIRNGKGGNLEDRDYITGRVRIGLCESSRLLLENFQNNFGGGLTERNLNQKNPVWQNAVTWQIQGKRIIGFLQNIKNHLILKRNQAEFLLNYMTKFSGQRFDEPALGQKFRTECLNELKAMKRDLHRLSDPTTIFNSLMR